MILGFKPQFKKRILNGSKVHSIRPDKSKRWKPGNIIHFATGVRTKNYDNFMKGECKSVQDIELKLYRSGLFMISIDGKLPLHKEPALQLAKNDGFDSLDDMYDLLFGMYCKNKKKFKVLTLKMRLIHWTNLKY
ncbi:MAG: hypothetical protein UZ05_CHB002000281 [Chlorobi bacterium OLB5]|nr:MAG: hypothetical protein UZ05_CHB002000281 [Chlorobi bacterium OLB5]